MSRLIDADELVTILDEELQKDSSLSKVLLVGFAKQILNDAPSVDAVEVVRCKECKWSYWQDETEWTYEGLYCRQYEASMHDDDYCSRGERKTE